MKRILLPCAAALCVLGGCNSETQVPASRASDLLNTAAPPSPDYVHFEGIWQGMVTPAETGTSLSAIVMVNGWGEFRLVADGMQLVGFPKRTASSVVGEITGITSVDTTWNSGSRIADFTLHGEISADNFISARYSGSSDNGTMAVAWATTHSPTRIESIEGLWVQHDQAENIVATVQIDVYDGWQARISGSRSNGCNYFGNIEAWTSELSYDVTPLEVSGCPPSNGIDVNGTYSGTSALIDIADDGSDELILAVALTNEVNQISLFLHRLAEPRGQ